MSSDFEKIKYWYTMGVWNAAKVSAAVKAGKITPAEYEQITGKVYQS